MLKWAWVQYIALWTFVYAALWIINRVLFEGRVINARRIDETGGGGKVKVH